MLFHVKISKAVLGGVILLSTSLSVKSQELSAPPVKYALSRVFSLSCLPNEVTLFILFRDGRIEPVPAEIVKQVATNSTEVKILVSAEVLGKKADRVEQVLPYARCGDTLASVSSASSNITELGFIKLEEAEKLFSEAIRALLQQKKELTTKKSSLQDALRRLNQDIDIIAGLEKIVETKQKIIARERLAAEVQAEEQLISQRVKQVEADHSIDNSSVQFLTLSRELALVAQLQRQAEDQGKKTPSIKKVELLAALADKFSIEELEAQVHEIKRRISLAGTEGESTDQTLQ